MAKEINTIGVLTSGGDAPGMDIYDIMKITGHSTPMMLNKYIKADQLEVVEKITDKYDYSD